MFTSLLMFGRLGRLIVSSRNCATFKVLTARKSLLNGGGVNSELDRVLIEAQEIVHYSMLVLNRTRNEVIDSLRQVYGDRDHHLLQATEASYYNNVNIQMRELVLLLMSKVTHRQYEVINSDSAPLNSQSEIVKKQLTLTEIIELIYKTNLLHQTIANHRVGESSRLKTEDWNIHYNNKLAILFGDFYVARAWASLGRLRSIDVNLLMSQGISDFTQGQFIMQSDAQLPSSSPPSPLPPTTVSLSSTKGRQKDDVHNDETNWSPVSIWEKRHYLMNASLPGHACQSISAVAGFNLFLQEAAFKFGKNFSLCWQILTEMEPFLSPNNSNHVNLHSEHSKSTNSPTTTSTTTTTTTLITPSPPELVIDLMSLPVLLQMSDGESIINSQSNQKEILIDPDSFTNPINNNQATQIDIDKLYSSITGGPVIERIRSIRNQYADEALNAINCFAKCDASCALINILNAIKET